MTFIFLRKKIIPLFIVLLFIAGCGKNAAVSPVNQPISSIVYATAFTAQQISELGLVKKNEEYSLENTQAYTDRDGNTVIYSYSAPIDEGVNINAEPDGSYAAES